ncbi:MAG: DUF3486 family protein [Treponema sp.]|jgi:hypothetical protein|nr:DUF3486 family protein [Treponema sp.]
MPRRSKIELQGLVEEIIRLYYTEGKRQEDIADELLAKGYEASKGGVNRALKNHAKQLKELKAKQQWAETLIAATDKTPRLSIADAGLQIAATKLLEEVSELEELGDMEPEKLVTLLTRVSRAIGLAANVELNFERGRKAGILETRKKLEEAARSVELPETVLNAIKAQLFGLETRPEDPHEPG